jgi:FkbM family methyltransferase
MADLLRQLLPTREGLFIDVGVNLGQTLVKVKDIDPERSYLGFEPNPSCVAFTERMIPALGLRNCRTVPAGLSSETGIVELAMISASQTIECAGGLPEECRRARLRWPAGRPFQ